MGHQYGCQSCSHITFLAPTDVSIVNTCDKEESDKIGTERPIPSLLGTLKKSGPGGHHRDVYRDLTPNSKRPSNPKHDKK